MIVVYALPVVEDAILSTYKKAEISSESKMWKDVKIEEMSSLYEMTLGNCRVAQG